MSTKVPITNVGAIGVIKDLPDYELPPEAWTDSTGMSFIEGGGVSKRLGTESALDVVPPLGEPLWILPGFQSAYGPYWVYAGTGFLAFTNAGGTTHTSLAAAVGNTRDERWSGGIFGGVGVFNNVHIDPRMWNVAAGSSSALTNWPANTKARVLRPHGRFLVAGGIIESGTVYAQRVKWSSSAPIGFVPATWDETDATKDSREWDLAETGGEIVDMRSLGDTNFIYKTDEIHAMDWIGGVYVFKFARKFGVGVRAMDCVVEYNKRHYIATPDDVVMHDGFTMESILDNKVRRWYAARTGKSYMSRSFVGLARHEMYVALFTAAAVEPSEALLIDLRTGTCAPITPPGGFANFAVGNMYNLEDTTRQEERMLFGLGGFYFGDYGGIDDGAPYGPILARVERTGLTVSGVDRFNAPKSDPRTTKRVSRIWPKVTFRGVGQTLNVYCGAVDNPKAAYPYEFKLFDPAVAPYVEFDDVVGAYIGVKFENSAYGYWQLDSYDIEMDVIGQTPA